MNINLILSKISLRGFSRFTMGLLILLQIINAILFLSQNNFQKASYSFVLAFWIGMTAFWESKANRLSVEKQNLEEFLANPEEAKGE